MIKKTHLQITASPLCLQFISRPHVAGECANQRMHFGCRGFLVLTVLRVLIYILL